MASAGASRPGWPLPVAVNHDGDLTAGMRPLLSWRDGRFSDWIAVLGDKTYHLHKYNLARGSSFFEAAMAEEYASSQTDLTCILPKACWPIFDDLLDALYGEGQEATEERISQQRDRPLGPDGVLTPQTAVLLLAAADALGCQSLLDRSLRYIWRSLPDCALTFWEYLAILPQPLSLALEKVAVATREGLCRSFERFLSMERSALLRLPPDFLLDLLKEDSLAVRAEVRLLEFLLEYGRLHQLVPTEDHGKMADSWTEGAAKTSTKGGTAAAAVEGAASRETPSLPSSSSSHDGRGILETLSDGPIDSPKADDCLGGRERSRSRSPRRARDKVASVDLEKLKAGVWRELCCAVRWGEIELWQLEHVFRNPESGALTLRQEQGTLPQYGLDPAIPEDLVSCGMRYQVMQNAPKWAFQRFMHLGVTPGITLRPRTPVRPPHCLPLESNQVEKFVHFDPRAGIWRPGDAIDSPVARVGKLRFQLKLQPGGEVGEEYSEGAWAVAAYIRVVPEASWPDEWEFRDVEYSIYVVPWCDKLKSSVVWMRDRFTFNSNGHNNNRGWHDFLTSKMSFVQESLRDILSPEGYLLVRAEVVPSSAVQGPALW